MQDALYWLTYRADREKIDEQEKERNEAPSKAPKHQPINSPS